MMPRSRPLAASLPSFLRLLRLALPAGVLVAGGSIAACATSDVESQTGSSGQGGAAGSAANGTGGIGGGMGGGTSTQSATGTGSGTGGGGPTPCMANSDCAMPNLPVCDTGTGDCVECLPTDDPCPPFQYCKPTTNTCEVGCTDQADCMAPLLCDTMTNQCVGCVMDTDCALGSICFNGSCFPGCSMQQGCAGTDTCCIDTCYDLQTDPLNCGSCGNVCPKPDNATADCTGGMCGMGACTGAFADCNQDIADGCEWNTLQDGPCVCIPGDTMSCYQGAPGTQGVGPCMAGISTCAASGTAWGPCVGQVLPTTEVCANGIDEDCNGTADDSLDADGDGWKRCDGDCCDAFADGCVDPTLVNPGAFDFSGDGFDDDCDGTVDNGGVTCDSGLASNASIALDYAKAIDLCAATTENPPLAQKRWGVITANLYLANGAGVPNAQSRSIRQGFGSYVVPLKGARLAVMSTGRAAAQAAPNNTNPNWAAFQGGQIMGTTSTVPFDWLAANGNNFPNAPGCPDPQGGTNAYDSVMLKLRVRVPTNAKSFNVSTYFYSAEYSEWVCSAFNDFFLTLLDSTFMPGPGETPNPADKNLAFYDPPPAGPPYYPVGVNLAFGNTGLFTQCVNGPTGCGSGSVPGTTNTCTSLNGILGTGFDILNPPSQFPGDPGYCGSSNRAGGGTNWLTTSGNVKPGETIEVRFVIWDTGDAYYDSVSLLDNFTWAAAPATPGTHN